MCDRMLQDSLRCYRGPGPGRGVGIRVRARGVDSVPGRGVGRGFRPGARGVRGFGPRRGVGWDSDPGCGVGWGFRPERGVGIFWGKMGNFLPFCRFFAVWVEISGQWNLESLPFSGKNGCLGRDFRTAEFGISTFSRQKWLLG